MIKIGRNVILKLHDDNVRKYGGDLGFVDEGTFDMLCSQPYQSVFGADLYPTVIDRAAKLMEGFATHQAFRDGNKRTGFAAMNLFLNVNGMELSMSPKDAEIFVMDVSTGKIRGTGAVSQILSENVMPFDVKQIEMVDEAAYLDRE